MEELLIQQAKDLQLAIEQHLSTGEKSLALMSINRNLKIGLTVAGKVSTDLSPEGKVKRWKPFTADVTKTVAQNKPKETQEMDKKFLESLKDKSVEDLKNKNNKTSLEIIVKAINEAEPDEAKRIVMKEDAIKEDYAVAILKYLNPTPAE